MASPLEFSLDLVIDAKKLLEDLDPIPETILKAERLLLDTLKNSEVSLQQVLAKRGDRLKRHAECAERALTVSKSVCEEVKTITHIHAESVLEAAKTGILTKEDLEKAKLFDCLSQESFKSYRKEVDDLTDIQEAVDADSIDQLLRFIDESHRHRMAIDKQVESQLQTIQDQQLIAFNQRDQK